ncbi:hypothetical protein PUN28_019692 [Cardiocondyla obscurior]|uniref:Uncharacterized protein n=1 Tax=Cardiocondyla obscurior TaxID=286306 RepID=A0AAW2EA18_9HYME
MIAEDWEKSENAEEKNIMIRRVQTARPIIIFAYIITAVGCLFIIVFPRLGMSIRVISNITDPGRLLPLQPHYIFDVTTQRLLYELTYISQVIYIGLGVVSYIGIDHFLALLIFHISGQLDIIKNRLIHLNKYINSRNMLRKCIKQHIRLLRIIAIIEDTYNITLLSLFAYFAIYFALLGFRIITLFNEGNDLSLTRFIFFVAAITNLFGTLCLYCIMGEFLVAQCNGIYYAAYSNEWYSADPKLVQDLLILLIRGTKPIYLTAGKMFPLTVTTFFNVRLCYYDI